jgi:type III secretion protein W
MSDPHNIPSSSPIEPARYAQMRAQRAALESRILRQLDEAQEDFQEWAEKGFDGVQKRKFKTLSELQKQRPRTKFGREEKIQDDLRKVEGNKKAQDTAAKFEQRNEELKAKTLLILLSRLLAEDDPETILKKVLEIYSDYSLADEAFEYVEEVSVGKLRENVRIAKELLNERYGREVRAGKNIAAEAKSFSQQGLGSPTALRDMYRDVTGHPREALKLFNELFAQFSYTKMKTVIDFLLHSLGSDLKAKGPSIEPAELQKLFEDARHLQAILGVYRFFESRMNLIYSQFHANHLTMTSSFNFEALARQYLALLMERYLSPDKVLQTSKNLGLLEEILAQIIIITQFRDAVRNVSPRLYRNNKHKEDLLEAIIEALEELEEEQEEGEEE